MLRVLLVGTTLLVAALGFEQRRSGGPPLIDLEREANLPALWSGFLLVAAAASALAAARADGRGARWPWWPLALLLFFMAGDEVLRIHEWLERRSGIDWHVLYLPVIAAGAAAALGVVLRLRDDPVLAAGIVASGAAWALAQVLEALQWDGSRQVAGYGPMMVSEEILEMAGSLGFTLTLLAAAARFRSRVVPRRLEMSGAVSR